MASFKQLLLRALRGRVCGGIDTRIPFCCGKNVLLKTKKCCFRQKRICEFLVQVKILDIVFANYQNAMHFKRKPNRHIK